MRIKKEAEIEKHKQAIKTQAMTLILAEGLDQLSMRKLAASLQMTVGNLYHYYANKDSLLADLVLEGYQKIVKLIQDAKDETLSCEKQLYATFYAYIKGMLAQKELYEIMMNSNHSVIKQQTQILEKGIREHRSSIQMLCQLLQKGVQQQEFEIEDIELSAQCIWCAVFGLIDRLIKEKVAQQQAERLINAQLEAQLRSIRKIG